MSRVGTTWRWLEARPAKALAISLGFVVLLRIAFVSMPLESDEGGFLMVARQWHGAGSSLYTGQWVDRPPAILLFFKALVWLGSDAVTLRLAAIGLALLGTYSAWYAGSIVAGARGAVAAGVVSASVGSMFAIDGYSLTGECIAGAVVMASVALLLRARFDVPAAQRAAATAFAAGLLAAVAFLVKQNFVDAVVVAAVLLGVRPGRTWRLLAGFAAGLAVPVAATVAWAASSSGSGLGELWGAMVTFRRKSVETIANASAAAPLERLRILLLLFVVTGLAALVVQLVIAARRVEGVRAIRLALVVWLAYDVVSIAAGASWWTHYLLQLTNVLALGAALATRVPSATALVRVPVLYTAVASAASAAVGIVLLATGHAKNGNDETLGEYLRAAAAPGDSVVMAYGAPSVIEQSGMPTPYEYSWSLPMRTRDPHLTELVEVLSGPDAPTWLVEIGDFNWWEIDTPAFAAARASGYRVVATVCGHDVYLRDGLTRHLPASPAC